MLLIVLAATTCAPSTPTRQPVAETPASALTPVLPLPTPTMTWSYAEMTVGFIQAGSESQWQINNTTSFKEAAQNLGITLKLFDAQFNPEAQITAFHDLIQDPDVNAIVINAIEPTGWDELLKQARTAGKLVIFEDRPIAAPEELYTTFIGSDFVEEGRQAAVEMCQQLNGSQKNVWELTGYVADRDAYKVNQRSEGFREKTGECGITLSPTSVANQSDMEDEAALETFLRNTDIQGLFLQNQYLAKSALRAIKAAGLKPGIDIKIVAMDCWDTGGVRESMWAGEINACVEYNFLLAPQVYAAALKALNGELPPKRLPVQEHVLYAKDVDHSHY